MHFKIQSQTGQVANNKDRQRVAMFVANFTLPNWLFSFAKKQRAWSGACGDAWRDMQNLRVARNNATF